MIKKSIHRIFRGLGYQLQAINPKVEKFKSDFFKFTNSDEDFYTTPIGNYYLPNNAPEDVIINAMKNGIYFDQHIIDIANEYIRAGSVVLDIGANLGQMSIYFSKRVGEIGKVYSFDADDYIFRFLQKNLSANNCENAEAIFGAVYNVSDKILHFPKQDFVKYGAYGSYGLNPSSNDGRQVKSIKIDDLNIQGDISFIKIDIQGSDLFALEGAKETILKNKMPIIFEFEQQFQAEFKTSFQDYVDFVDSISYKFHSVVDGINYLIVPR
jgi:FkbM family methyltransferase